MAFQVLPSGISEAGAVYQYLTHIFLFPIEETLPYLGQDDWKLKTVKWKKYKVDLVQ